MKHATQPHQPSSPGHIQRRIEALMPCLSGAAIGDYSRDVPLGAPHDELSELYAGVQLMIEAIREKGSRQDSLNTDLEDIVSARSSELYGSETRFGAIAAAATDAIVISNGTKGIVYMNRAAEITLGYAPDQIKGQGLASIVPILNVRYIKSLPGPPSSKNRKLGTPIQATATHKNGQAFPVELSFAIWENVNESYVAVIMRDLTAHQVLVDELAESNQIADQNRPLRSKLVEAVRTRIEVEGILKSIGEGVVAMDRTGQVFFANAEAGRIMDVDPDRIKNHDFFSTIKLYDEAGRTVPYALRLTHRALKTGQSVSSGDFFIRSTGGVHMPIHLTATPVIAGGKVIGVIDVMRDITKEKAADQLKSDFVSLASHQLRTPATAVKGLLALLLEGYSGKLVPAQATIIQQAFTENDHELQLVDDMLNVAKLDAGEVVLECSDVDMGKMIADVIAEQRDLIRQRRQTVAVSCPRPVKIWADPAKLQIVFENLLTNASKYSPENSRVTVSVRLINAQAVVRIKDHGMGIAAEDMHLIFKRFSRAANAAKSPVSGSGLGLYMAEKIVELHHGSISVTSRLKHGTVFTVALPKQTKEKPWSISSS